MMKTNTLIQWKIGLIMTAVGLLFSGCLSMPIEIAHTVVDTSFDVAETAVEVPLDVAGGVADVHFSRFEVKLCEEQNWTLHRENAQQVEVEAINGSIEITGVDSDQVVIKAWKEIGAHRGSSVNKYMPQVELFARHTGNRIQIGSSRPMLPHDVYLSTRYELQIPKAIALHLTSSNGRIHIQGVNGRIQAQTSNGSIELYNGACNADLNTSNGRIEVAGIEGTIQAETTNSSIVVKQGRGHFTLNTTNGDIVLEDCSGSVHARTSNSAIRADLLRLEGEGYFATGNASVDVTLHAGSSPITIETNNGSIHASLPPDYRGYLHASTNHGTIKSDFPVTVHETETHRLDGAIGMGGDVRLHLTTSNGNIHIEKVK